MFWRKFKSPTAKSLPNLQQLDFGRIPILKAQELIALLGLEQRLNAIEKLTGAGSEYFQLLYAPALRQYIESVQLAPASTAHHHAGPGGLVVHTLDVIDHALRKRKSYNLPQQSVPEIIAQQEHVWTYAIFGGALLHDIGKLVCNTKLVLDTGAVWTPHHASILNSGATHYTVVFERGVYNLHTHLSNGFLHLLPPRGRGWLAQFPDILAQLTAWLAGEPYDWGIIGEIVQQADGESVTKNLKLGGDRKRFPNAPTAPLVDKLTTALRQLLDEGQLKINRLDGSAGWCDGPHTYLVSGTVADAVRTHLYSAGATEVPLDNSRIFDTWQEHGFVESTPDGGTIWHLTINGKLSLTVLKFETGRIFHPSRRPDAFIGQLEVFAQKPKLTTNGGTPTAPSTSPSGGGTPTTSSVPPAIGWAPSTAENMNQEEDQDNITATDRPDDHYVKTFYMAEIHKTSTTREYGTTANLTQGHEDAPKHMTLDDPEMARHFLDWVKTGLQDNRITLNRADALLHVVKEGVLIVSPLAFKLFARQFNLVEDGADPQDLAKRETMAATKIQKKFERSMAKEKIHIKTKHGLNIHTYLVQGEHKESKIRGWLLPLSAIFSDGPTPDPNPALMNLSGFKEKTESKSMNSYFLGIDDN
jgi:integrating conjugative element relaxase (TIGR03760 family)